MYKKIPGYGDAASDAVGAVSNAGLWMIGLAVVVGLAWLMSKK